MLKTTNIITNRYPHCACIALGANLGDRELSLHRALHTLNSQDTRVDAMSSFFDTDPVGGPPNQPRYLNAAAVVSTALSPRKFLNALLDIERILGRDRSSPERNQPRVIDLDLLLYDDVIVNEPGLELPHPRMHERLFVLEPLSEIAPHWVHPVSKKTIEDLFVEVAKDQTK